MPGRGENVMNDNKYNELRFHGWTFQVVAALADGGVAIR